MHFHILKGTKIKQNVISRHVSWNKHFYFPTGRKKINHTICLIKLNNPGRYTILIKHFFTQIFYLLFLLEQHQKKNNSTVTNINNIIYNISWCKSNEEEKNCHLLTLDFQFVSIFLQKQKILCRVSTLLWIGSVDLQKKIS